MNLPFSTMTKPKMVEEFVDYYLHRRLAIPVVYAASQLGLKPNHLTFASLLLGCLSAFFYFRDQFLLGTFFLLVAVVFDCSDGMLARLTHQASPAGRLLDGIFDLIWIVLIWVGIFRSGHFQYSSHQLLQLMIPASVSMTLHCFSYDGIKNGYLSCCEPAYSEQAITWQEAYQRMKRSSSPFHAFLYGCVFAHHFLFGRDNSQKSLSPAEREHAKQRLRLPMRLWSFLGEGTHLALMVCCGGLTPLYPDSMLIAFLVMLIPMNLLWALALLLWFQRKRECAS